MDRDGTQAAGFRSWWIIGGWAGLAVFVFALIGVLTVFGERFSWERDLADIPALWAAGVLVGGGLVFVVCVVSLIWISGSLSKRQAAGVFWCVVGAGLIMRIALLGSVPVLEDDFYRYLWDGGVSAHGFNPFAVAPASVGTGAVPAELNRLAADAGLVHERINHPNLKTIYPPVTQGMFAVAHLFSPWSLLAWRVVCLICDAATLVFVVALLRALGRSQLWAALYWWHPLVLKEVINTAHMEAVLMPFVMGALWLGVRGRYTWASVLLGLGAGAKIWPLFLAPIILRPLLANPRRLVVPVLILAGMCALWALPPLLGGLGDTSGFVAYATFWKTNSALFPVLETISKWVLVPAGLEPHTVSRGLRALAGVAVLSVAVLVALRPLGGPLDFVRRAVVVTCALFLVSPAQFPWYLLWLLPMMTLCPVWGIIFASVLVPAYYASFYFLAQDTYDVYKAYVVWAIWLPVWGVLAWQVAWPRWFSKMRG